MNKSFKEKLFLFFIYFFSTLAMLPLVVILIFIFKKGFSVINWDFFTHLPPSPGEGTGGIANALTGTIELIIIAFILAVPASIIIGIYVAEAKNRFANILSVGINILQSIPSIVIGVIAYLWVVKPLKGFSALSGGVALALMMLPLIIKATEETVKMIPPYLKEAAYALGAGYRHTILKVILPASSGGIISGILLALARIAGETAPLLFTAFGNPFINLNPLKPVDSLPLLIFNYSMSPYDNWHAVAWGASVVLILLVLIFQITGKMVSEKWKVEF